MNKRKRIHEIHLRLNSEEYAALEENRKKCNLPQQTYLRYMCLNVVPKETPPADYFSVLKELRRIGNNLNQLAQIAHKNNSFNANDYTSNCQNLWNIISTLVHCVMFAENEYHDYVQELIERQIKKDNPICPNKKE